MKRLLDSNILIYAARPEHTGLRRWLSEPAGLSVISIVEVLGFPGLNEQDAADFEMWLSRLDLYEVTESIVRLAANLRRKKRIKLADAIIAATAIEIEAELVTRNVSDFRSISGLTVVNPFDGR